MHESVGGAYERGEEGAVGGEEGGGWEGRGEGEDVVFGDLVDIHVSIGVKGRLGWIGRYLGWKKVGGETQRTL